jgi:hypothetical protein
VGALAKFGAHRLQHSRLLTEYFLRLIIAYFSGNCVGQERCGVLSQRLRTDVLGQRRRLREADSEFVGKLLPEVKVNMAIDMTDAMVGVCAEGIKVRNPAISQEELLEKLRERLEWTRRRQKRRG